MAGFLFEMPNGDCAYQYYQCIVVRFNGKRKTVSTAILNGGYREDQLTRRVTLGRIRMTVVARTIRVACRYFACFHMALLPLFLLVCRPVACRASQDGAGHRGADKKAAPAKPGGGTLHG